MSHVLKGQCLDLFFVWELYTGYIYHMGHALNHAPLNCITNAGASPWPNIGCTKCISIQRVIKWGQNDVIRSSNLVLFESPIWTQMTISNICIKICFSNTLHLSLVIFWMFQLHVHVGACSNRFLPVLIKSVMLRIWC